MLEFISCILIGVVAVLMATLPWSIPAFTQHKPGVDGRYEKFLVVLLISGVVAILILWQTRWMMRIINRGTPFIMDMVRRMRLVAAECLFIAVVYFISIFLVTKFFMAVVFVAFSLVGGILFIFAEVFRQAVNYKEENDMTI